MGFRVALVIFLLLPSMASSKQLTFSCPSTEDMVGGQYVRSLIKTVARKQGHTVNIRHFTGSEMKKLYRMSRLDGDCARLDGFSKKMGFSDFEKVESSYGVVTLSLWAGRHSSRVLSESRVGYLSGTPTIKVFIEKLSSRPAVEYQTTRDLLVALRDQEVDYIATWHGLMQSQKKILEQYGITYYQNLAIFPGYIYTHKKYVSLNKKLNKEIIRRRKIGVEYKDKSDFKRLRSANKIIFSCSLDSEGDSFKRIERMFKEIFKALGREFQMVGISRAREVQELQENNVDGSCARSPELVKVLDSVKIVPVLFAKRKATVWGHKLSSKDSANVLADDAAIAYVRGSVFMKGQLTAEQVDKAIMIESAESGLKMLSAKRIDYLVAMDVVVGDVMKRVSFTQPIYMVKRLTDHKFYPLLQNKHAGLLEPLTEGLNQYLEQEQRDSLLGP